jgi:hypothetical protein
MSSCLKMAPTMATPLLPSSSPLWMAAPFQLNFRNWLVVLTVIVRLLLLELLLFSCRLSRICCLARNVVPLFVLRPLPRNECCFRTFASNRFFSGSTDLLSVKMPQYELNTSIKFKHQRAIFSTFKINCVKLIKELTIRKISKVLNKLLLWWQR